MHRYSFFHNAQVVPNFDEMQLQLEHTPLLRELTQCEILIHYYNTGIEQNYAL